MACSARSAARIVPAPRNLNQLAALGQRGREGRVHRRLAQRRRIGRAVVDRGEGERLQVRRGDHHDPLDLPPLQKRVGVRRHAARIDVPGVRRDQRHDVLDLRRLGLGQEAVQHLAELARIGRIERPGVRRRPRPLRLRLARRLEAGEQQQDQESPLVHESHPHTPGMGCWQYRQRPLTRFRTLG